MLLFYWAARPGRLCATSLQAFVVKQREGEEEEIRKTEDGKNEI
jgi:hypothetical protein